MIPMAQTTLDYFLRRIDSGGMDHEEAQNSGSHANGCERALPWGERNRNRGCGIEPAARNQDKQAQPGARLLLPELSTAHLSGQSHVPVGAKIRSTGRPLTQDDSLRRGDIESRASFLVVCILPFLVYNSGHLPNGGPMFSSLSTLQVVLWCAGIVSQSILALILISRKSWKTFPFFAVYVFQANAAAASIFLLAKYSSSLAYSMGFYFSAVIDSLLALLVICEFVAAAFGPRSARPRALTVYLASAMAGAYILTGSIGTIFLADNSWRRGEQLFVALATATLWVVFLCGDLMGLHWSKRTAAIGRGMLIYLTTELATAFVNGRVERPAAAMIGEICQLSYVVAVIFWCKAFWPQQSPLKAPTPEDLYLLRSVLGERQGAIEEMQEPSREAALK